MKFRLRKCACPFEYLSKARRRLWMRLFPSHRLYDSGRCGARIFVHKRDVESRVEWHDATIKTFIKKTLSRRRGDRYSPK